MFPRRPLSIVCLIAALHGLFFIWYQRPDWNIAWSDQDGYRRLGQVLAETGKFTRFPDAPRFVYCDDPEGHVFELMEMTRDETVAQILTTISIMEAAGEA